MNSQRLIERTNAAVIVDGAMLTLILAEEYKKEFFVEIAKTCETVICCRASPSQKADVVRLIKEDNRTIITAAIGDGANDVSMIREAHVGIGLYGNEGIRAAQSADMALSEFRFLWRLLFFHGANAYVRNAELILFFFYKNFLFTPPHVMFST